MISGLLLVLLGLLALVYVTYSWQKGKVRFGTWGAKAFIPDRDNDPLWFWLAMLTYAGFSAWAVIYGVMMMLGTVPPLPLN